MAFRVFLLLAALMAGLALFGDRLGLQGCADAPWVSLGPCAVGRGHDPSG
jgi:hypothetical protein